MSLPAERLLVLRRMSACFSGPGRGSFTLVPKVSEALWERARQEKLRFGGGRVSKGRAIVVVSRRGDRVSLPGAFPKRFANFGNEMNEMSGTL